MKLINKNCIPQYSIGVIVFSLRFYVELFTDTQVLGLALLFILIDFKHILCLKNYFLIYTFIIFIIGAGVFYPDEGIDIYFVYFVVSFALGYHCFKIYSSNMAPLIDYDVDNARVDVIDVVTKLFKLLIFVQVLLVCVSIIQSGGLDSYLSGESLVSKIDNYKKKDISLGVVTIINQMVAIFSFAAFVILTGLLIRNKKKEYGLFAFYLIGLPIMSLARGQLSFNLVLLVLIYTIYDNRKGIIKFKEYVIISCVFISIIVYGSIIGGLRSSHWVDNSSDSISDLALVSIGGELSPIIVFKDIVTDHEKLGMKYGMTIVPPLLLKIIPSNIYTDKPDNTIAYYSKIYSPDSFEQGHMLASTVFSDLYLNFGLLGSLFFIFILGIIVSYFDNIYMSGWISNIDYYLIVYFYFYTFLRNDIANSMSLIILTLVAYRIIHLYIKYKIKPIL